MNQVNSNQSHELGSLSMSGNASCPKSRVSVMLAILLCCSALNINTLFAQALPPTNRCDSVKAGEDINFRQIKLREIADISNPEIRRINALMSARCYDEATSAYSKFVAANPNDYKIRFVEGRMLWIFNGTGPAREAMAALIKQHPDFASAKVLMASLHIDANEFDDARKMLDQAAKSSPNDLWLFIDRLKLELLSITADTPKKYLEVLTNPQFPPSAREEVGLDYPYLPGVSPAMAEDAYKTLLSFESATPHHMKAAIVAFFLVTKKDPNKRLTKLKRFWRIHEIRAEQQC